MDSKRFSNNKNNFDQSMFFHHWQSRKEKTAGDERKMEIDEPLTDK